MCNLIHCFNREIRGGDKGMKGVKERKERDER
jgi:hypothetical protein